MNKKGVSEMVSYVLLIVIAVGISVLVYNYLSVYLPKDQPKCEDDVKLILQSYSCLSGNPGKLNLTIVNKGIFKVDAAYIRFGEEKRTVKTLINEDDLYFSMLVSGQGAGLDPGRSTVKEFVNLDISPGSYEVEIQPAMFTEDNQLALCESAVIVQPIECS